MPNKDGQYITRLPSQYRTKKSKKKVLKKEGDKHNYSIEKCPVCSKQKMEKYDLIDKGSSVTMRKCKNCNFINASSVFYNPPPENTPITYFKPSGSLEDKSEEQK